MRELEFAGQPSLDPARLPREGHATFPLSRAALVASLAAHAFGGYVLLQHRWVGAPPPAKPAEFFLFELPAPLPRGEAPAAAAPPQLEVPTPDSPPGAAEVAPPPIVLVEPAPVGGELGPAAEPEPATEPASTTAPAPAPVVDLDEARQRAAREVVSEGAAESPYLTFSLRDVAPPRPDEPDEPERSIFDGTGGSRGPSIGQLGQSRTKFGHRMASLCNALTGGGFSVLGWGSVCGGPPDGRPSGFFPEVRPDYLDSLPECVDTRDTAPALALEAPFPTVKCRLVKQGSVEQP